MAKSDLQRASLYEGLTENQLNAMIAQNTAENGKYLKSINNTLNWFFWIFIIGLALWLIGSMLTHQPTPVPVNPY